jgi:hypothetical protein
MFGCLQLDIGSKFYASGHILSWQLEDLFNHDVDADENHVLSPQEDTTAGGPLFCESKVSALLPRHASGACTFSNILGTLAVTFLFQKYTVKYIYHVTTCMAEINPCISNGLTTSSSRL